MCKSHLDPELRLSLPATGLDDHAHLRLLSPAQLFCVGLLVKQMNLVSKWFTIAVLPGHFAAGGRPTKTTSCENRNAQHSTLHIRSRHKRFNRHLNCRMRKHDRRTAACESTARTS